MPNLFTSIIKFLAKVNSSTNSSYLKAIPKFYDKTKTMSKVYETELQVTTLQNLYTSLKTQNAAVINSSTDISNARLSINETMYHAESGLVATAADVKKYVKSVYGASSPQFKQISTLSFKIVPL